jgi:predicted anti-sigma-YlaC factor YlaD
MYMRCEDVRVALSARIDGEDPGVAATSLTAHLDGCGECHSWLDRAEQVTRLARLRSLRVPDLTEAIMQAVAADRLDAARARAYAGEQDAVRAARRRAVERDGRRQILRLAVGAVAVAQLLVVLAELLPGLSVGIPLHARHELATFDAALAVGFLLAAWRPALARAYLPAAYVLAAGLALTAGVDLAHGVTTITEESGHLIAVVQAALLWGLSQTERRSGGQVPGVARA